MWIPNLVPRVSHLSVPSLAQVAVRCMRDPGNEVNWWTPRLFFTQGAYIGFFAGVSFSTWIFFGSIFYPPDTSPAVRSVRGCPFFLDARACQANITLPCYNSSTKILDKYGDGLIRNPYRPYTRLDVAYRFTLNTFTSSFLWSIHHTH